MKLAFNGVEFDLLEAETLISNAEIDSKAIVDGKLKPSASLFRALAEQLKQFGIEEATPTTAYCFWHSVLSIAEHYREQCRQDALIAYWFKLDPFKLTAEQKFGLMQNLPSVQAQDTIHQGNYDHCDYKGVYNLFSLAFKNEKLAEEMRNKALEAYVEKKTAER